MLAHSHPAATTPPATAGSPAPAPVDMAVTVTVAAAARVNAAQPVGGAAGILLDAEKLDVYKVALEFQVVSAKLVPRWERVLYDQLQRASLSIVLNIAEGSGRRSRKDKGRFYTIARGSATECAAYVDVALLRGLSAVVECRRARSLLVRIVSMLTRLTEALG